MSRRFPKDEPMEPDDLRPADRKILDVLEEGRATPDYLIHETGFEGTTIHDRLHVLREAGHVEQVHRALYELVDDPRDK